MTNNKNKIIENKILSKFKKIHQILVTNQTLQKAYQNKSSQQNKITTKQQFNQENIRHQLSTNYKIKNSPAKTPDHSIV